MTYQVNLERFSGPLDLLLHLIEKDELDMYEIPLAEITEEYINYLQTLEKLDLENISEFIAIAVHLLEIKASLIFPDPVKSDTAKETTQSLKQELVSKLVEYRKFKQAAVVLAEWEELAGQVYSRAAPFEEPALEMVLDEVPLAELTRRLERILRRRKVKKAVTKTVVLEQYTVAERMEQIMSAVDTAPEPIEFDSFFAADFDKLAVLTSFLAILELVKMNRLKIYQQANFAPIWLMKAGWIWKKKE